VRRVAMQIAGVLDIDVDHVELCSGRFHFAISGVP
jgi:hypothetical protein